MLSRAETPEEISKHLIKQRCGVPQLGDGVRMLGVPKQVLRDPGRAATTVALWISAPAKPARHVTTRNKGIHMRSWESWSMASIAISVAAVGHDGSVPTAACQRCQVKQHSPISRVAVGIWGLNAHNEEEESQHLPKKMCSSF